MAGPAVIIAVISFFGGATLPAGTAALMLPASVLVGARDVDAIAAKVASYAPDVCLATDAPLDKLSDRLDKRYGKKVTFMRRMLDSLTASADSICNDTQGSNNIISRSKAVIDAIYAIKKANSKLSEYETPKAPIITTNQFHVGR